MREQIQCGAGVAVHLKLCRFIYSLMAIGKYRVVKNFRQGESASSKIFTEWSSAQTQFGNKRANSMCVKSNNVYKVKGIEWIIKVAFIW